MTSTEPNLLQLLTSVWEDACDIKEIAAKDNFFSIGGDLERSEGVQPVVRAPKSTGTTPGSWLQM